MDADDGDDEARDTFSYESMDHVSMQERFEDAMHFAMAHIKEILIGVAVLVVMAFLMVSGISQMLWDKLSSWCMQLGILAVIPIVLLCILCQVVGFPVDPFLLGAGALFDEMYGLAKGGLVGIIACCIGVYVGCIVAFQLGRTLMKSKVDQHLNEYKMLQILNKVIETDGWKFAFVLRTSPLIPNEPVNYACSITSMSFGANLLATLGSLPKTAYEVWVAAQLHDQASGESGGINLWLMVGVNTIILIGMVVLCVVAKRKMDAAVHASHHVEDHHKVHFRKSITLKSFQAHTTIQEKRLKRAQTFQRSQSVYPIRSQEDRSVRRVSFS